MGYGTICKKLWPLEACQLPHETQLVKNLHTESSTHRLTHPHT